MKRILALILTLVFLLAVGCGTKPEPVEEPTPEPTAESGGEYAVKDASLMGGVPTAGASRVFYEIFVGSFSDSDGDGTGDLRGIINRMDYLNDGDPDSGLSLGVEGLWLTPIYSSPSYHKYDITDYYKVDPAFGTEADLKELIDLCHERDVWVILDLPINHTGRLNQWFGDFCVAHRNGDTENEFYDVYTWYDGDTEDAPAGRTFNVISGTNHFYECNFSGDMPELNFDSEKARSLVLDVAKHYIDLGVDGFRFDAAKYVYFNDHAKSAEFWDWYMDELRNMKSDVYCVAEVWDGDGITDKYYPYMDCFNFTISEASGLIAETAKKGDVNRYTAYISSYLERVRAMRDSATITPFITNHDMDRAAGFLTVASGFMKVAANLYILGPGTPFMYYGEELGMRGSRGGSNTDANRRLAMLWGDGDAVKNPVGTSYDEKNQIDTTVLDQIADEYSLYNYYKRLIMVRKANPEIALGSYTPLALSGTKVGGFIAEYNGSRVIVIHNTTGSTQQIDLSALGLNVTELRAVIGVEEASLEGGVLTIGGQTSVVLK